MRSLAAVGCLLGLRLALAGWPFASDAQTGAVQKTNVVADQSSYETATNPIADSRAVITVGQARFTVLTLQLIRMEWAADGKFEDHASLVFLNRRLPVPGFEQSFSQDKHKFILKTQALTLTYERAAWGLHFRQLQGNLRFPLTVTYHGCRSVSI